MTSFAFNTPDDLFRYLEGKKQMQEKEAPEITIALPQREMPDLTLVDTVAIVKVIAAVALILGIDMSDEKLAAVSLVMSVGIGALLYADTRRRGSRNERMASEVASVAEMTSIYHSLTSETEEDGE